MPRKAKLKTWTLTSASAEFGVHRETLQKRLTDGSHAPDEKGCYTTRQICGAIYGNASVERHQLVRAQRRLAELEAAKAERSVLDAEVVERTWTRFVQACRARWLQTPAKAAVAFSTWPDARACERWLDSEVKDILTEWAERPEYADGRDTQ